MPDTLQGLNEADKIAEYLGIKFINAPIGRITNEYKNIFVGTTVSTQTLQNIPPRARMTMLYAIAQTYNGRVIGTCNLSENYIGYFTAWGDGVSDCEPLANLTVTEVRALGHELGLPTEWVDKAPDDGLPHSSPDEVKFGFTYAVLDKYIREGECDDEDIKSKILERHNKNLFKMRRLALPSYNFLTENNIKFEQEKKFEWLKNKCNLRLDFYLPEYNIAIECQGEQHFIEEAWGKSKEENKENFATIKQRDRIKKTLCNENGIKLIYYFHNNYFLDKEIYNKKNVIKDLNDLRL